MSSIMTRSSSSAKSCDLGPARCPGQLGHVRPRQHAHRAARIGLAALMLGLGATQSLAAGYTWQGAPCDTTNWYATCGGDQCSTSPDKWWIHNNWGSPGNFLSAGFGVVAICETEIVSWSVADCRAGNTCEIGIRTAPEWRQRGMGSFTANGAVQHAFGSGLRSVGWHCPEENVASQRTAERAGFSLERTYSTYTICDRDRDAR